MGVNVVCRHGLYSGEVNKHIQIMITELSILCSTEAHWIRHGIAVRNLSQDTKKPVIQSQWMVETVQADQQP